MVVLDVGAWSFRFKGGQSGPVKPGRTSLRPEALGSGHEAGRIQESGVTRKNLGPGPSQSDRIKPV